MNKFLFAATAVVITGAVFSACQMDSRTTVNSTSSPMVAASSAPAADMTGDTMGTEDGVMVGGAMMTRDKDIVANAMSANNVTTVVAAVKAADLVATLQGAGPFTVFAPTDMAFQKLPVGTVETLLKPENKAQLQNILKYHVVAGRYPASSLKDGMKLTTVQGQELMITMKDGKVMVNGSAMVETADAISSNGVTHVIDMVLMPKN